MPQNQNFWMYAAKSQLFQRINECLQEINDPYRGFAIGPSNSLDETATPIRILDRGVDFWALKSRIFECMQRNHSFLQNLMKVSCKIRTFLRIFIYSQASSLHCPSWLSSEDVIMASDRSQLSFQIGANNSQMIQRVLSIAVDTIIWRLHGSQNVTYAIIPRSSNIPSHGL